MIEFIEPEVSSTVVARALARGAEPLEVSAGGTVFLLPNDIEVVYTSVHNGWAVAVTVNAVLSLERSGVPGHQWGWAASPLRWRGGPVLRPNLDEAPEWVRLFVSRNMPVTLAGGHRFG